MEERPTAIQEEFNLIAALALIDDFGMSILPLKGWPSLTVCLLESTFLSNI